jgi:sterol desaturase/sphingolipid hydroxylase (fatty acid hydroxylase superfamily)
LIKANKYWRYIENAVFVFAFFYISWDYVSGFFIYLYNTLLGKGIIADVKTQVKNHAFNDTFMTIVWEIIFVITLWEIGMLIYEGIKSSKGIKWGVEKLTVIYKHIAQTFKPTYLANFLSFYIPLLIKIDVFTMVTPFFNKFSLFIINKEWYSWIYAYLAWELSTWVWHFIFHRVRLFWCFHSPHHAPEDLTITTAWVHFFAEGYFTTVLQWIVLSVMGVPPEMLGPIMAIEIGWGTFIHAGERSLKKGRLGFLKYFLITPSHHRVHHAKNPLYMDTNFCTFLPFWDWLFGTLQPLRDEVKIEYGITRKIDVTSFIDFYFGEIILLFNDVKNAKGLKTKLLYVIKPPGWSPETVEHTAAMVRDNFLKENPGLGVTSKDFIVKKMSFKTALVKE